MNDLNVVVTGGTGALGSAVVGELLGRGARIFIPNFFPSVLDSFPHKDDERVTIVSDVDLSKEDKAKEYYASLPELWASVHIAGGFAMAPVVDTSAEDFEAMWRMNTLSCFLSCREAIRKIRESGKGGRIVNVSARPAVEPVGGMIAYTTSKAGVASMTQCLAHELKGDGILINAILPSIIDTAANRKAMPDADFDAWPKPEELAKAVAFAASRDNSLCSGALLPLYGQQL
jgi:NAD(P)-dependent dehydrogenase (short-subunit alcohol dehydrogenase family)